MVEGPNDKKVKTHINFIKLTRRELSDKIALLVSNHTRIVFWKTTPKFYEGFVHSSSEHGRFQITLEKCVSLVKFVDEIICLNFKINDIDYFFKAQVLKHEDSENRITFEVFEDCFRLEKRSKERLQTYPHYEAYAYIKYFITGPENVIQFNKKIDTKNSNDSKDFLNSINSERLSKLKSISEDLNVDEEEDVIGFRIEDLSASGSSFVASSKERETVIALLEQNPFSLTITFEKEAYTLKDAKIVYVMDYIHPSYVGTSMYKVGITFNQSPSLKRRIEDISGIVVDIVDHQKEFEEFIKND